MKKMGVKSFVLGFLLLFSWSTIGMAADFPERPIRLITPYSAGGGTDRFCRTIKPFLEKYPGWRIVVENIPGGATKIGTMELMKAKPDGHTLIVGLSEAWVGYYYSKTYDIKIWEHMTPIATLSCIPYAFVEVRVESPFKTWADLVKAAKEKPGVMTCGGSGAGGMYELIKNQITKAAGIETRYVPFAGSSPAGVALYGGHVDFRLCAPSDAWAMIRAGKSRGLGVSSDERMNIYPDVPTFKELGIGGTIPMTKTLWGPPKVPASLVKAITEIIKKAIEDPEYVKIAQQILSPVNYRSPERTKADIQNFDKEFGPKLAEMYK
jgi:tripartite-type tricarboxylate transporter receptor subunit TctC